MGSSHPAAPDHGAFTYAVKEVLDLPPKELGDLRDRLLVEMVRLVSAAHPFYSRRFREAGVSPADIRGVRDLERLPLTTKTDFLSDPDAFRLDADLVPAELDALWPVTMRHLWEIVYTTGTTSGRPAPVYNTTFDVHAYMFNVLRRRPFIDIGPGDVIGSAFPMTPFPMGAHTRAGAEAAVYGAAIVYAQTGQGHGPFGLQRSLDEAVRLFEQSRITVLWGIASFVRRFLERAAGLEADLARLRIVMFTGERSSPALMDDMRAQLVRLGVEGARLIDRYGSTEQGSAMVQCAEGSGFHNLAPDQVLMESVDPATGETLPDGRVGHLAMSHLMRRGTVLLRYLPGDIASLDRSRCTACGRESERVGPGITRSGNLTKVKGTLVDLGQIDDIVEGFVGQAGHQIVVQRLRADDPVSPDELVIRVAEHRLSEADVEALKARVAKHAYVTPRIEPMIVVPTEEAVGPVKLRRIFDLRLASEER